MPMSFLPQKYQEDILTLLIKLFKKNISILGNSSHDNTGRIIHGQAFHSLP